jgi:hypothetical protein
MSLLLALYEACSAERSISNEASPELSHEQQISICKPVTTVLTMPFGDYELDIQS